MTILLAATRPTIRTVEIILRKSAKLLPAIRMVDALRLLNAGVDLIVCSVQFDESRMFELLRAAKSNPQTRGIPFLCFRHLDSVLRPASFKGLAMACRAYGAEFIDLAAWRAQYGTEEAQERFRETVLSRVEDGSTVG